MVEKCGLKFTSLGITYKEPFGGNIVRIRSDTDFFEMSKWIPAYRSIDMFVELEDFLVSVGHPDPEDETNLEHYEQPIDSDSEESSCPDSLVDDEYQVNVDDFVQPERETEPDSQPQTYQNEYQPETEFNHSYHIENYSEAEIEPEEPYLHPCHQQSLSTYNPEPIPEVGDSDVGEYDELVSLHSSEESEEDGGAQSKRKRFHVFNKENDMKNPYFKVGMLFDSPQTFREAVREYSILNNKDIKFKKNDKWKIRVKCDEPCTWFVYVNRYKKEMGVQVKTLQLNHSNCRPSFHNTNVSARWLAKRYEDHVRTNPQWPLTAFKQQVKRDFNMGVSTTQVYNARRFAQEAIEGSHKQQYALLWRYCEEVRRVMPNSTMSVYIDEESWSDHSPRFKRLYCCLGPLKKGFLEACRPIIGVDGCFLKGPYPGQLLSAVGIDANNGIFPFAYAIVEQENKSSWTWFLQHLSQDIGIDHESSNYTFMSDQQKVHVFFQI